MKVIAVPTTNPASELTQADIIVNRLDELSIAQLEKIFTIFIQ
jgi:beta-phosphoglucomutase-like phosphatase (HAD superfamily)